MIGRLVSVFAVCLLSFCKPCLAGHPDVDLSDDPKLVTEPTPDNNSTQRACTMDELLPQTSEKSMCEEWSDKDIVGYPYNCSCPAMKARYVCPTQKRLAYPKWEPRPVTSGACTSVTREELDVAPFPPNFKVLMYGNSHMRQMLESIMCMFQGTLTSKSVTVGPLAVTRIVESDSQCRACYDINQPIGVSSLHRMLLDNECIDENDDSFTCRCDDSHGEFFFENGASVHYTMSGQQRDKNLKNAQIKHENHTISSYDAVMMNAGNPPHMKPSAALASAIEVQNTGPQFFWLSTYADNTGVDTWPESERDRFAESGAKFVDVHRMTQGMQNWNKGHLESSHDSHFCMPGPTNEIAILMLKLMWAAHDEAK